MEDNAEGDRNCRCPAQEVSDRKSTGVHSFDVLVKNVAGFCPYLKNMPEVKLSFWNNGIGREDFKIA